jgi:hypothetical protein
MVAAIIPGVIPVASPIPRVIEGIIVTIAVTKADAHMKTGAIGPRIVVPWVVEVIRGVVVGIVVITGEVARVLIWAIVGVAVVIIVVIVVIPIDDDTVAIFTLVLLDFYVIRLVIVVIPIGRGKLGVAPRTAKKKQPGRQPERNDCRGALQQEMRIKRSFHGSARVRSETDDEQKLVWLR